MKKQLFLLIALVSAVLSICSSCKDSPNNPDIIKVCDPNQCTSWTGQECVSGDCQCLKGKRRVEGMCYGSDTTFVGSAKNKFWKDTAIFTIYKSQTNANWLAFDIEMREIKNGYGVPWVVGKTFMHRIRDTKSDSIHEANISDYNIITADGTLLVPEFKGRILDSNTIRLQVTFCTRLAFGQIDKRIDSTEYIFRKIQ